MSIVEVVTVDNISPCINACKLVEGTYWEKTMTDYEWSDVFYYDGESLFWKETGAFAGTSLLGTNARTRYIRVQYKRNRFYVHRIIWEMHFGSIPDNMYIDHIDGNGENNRLANLRLVTYGINSKNRKKQSNNLSGVCGVSWASQRGKWRAFIKENGKQKHLGYFDDLEEAAQRRREEEQIMGFTDRHGK